MGITASQLEKEIKEIEGVQVIVHQSGQHLDSYSARWKKGLGDERTVKAFKKRINGVAPGVSYSICKPDGGKSIFPHVTMGALRGKVKEEQTT